METTLKDGGVPFGPGIEEHTATSRPPKGKPKTVASSHVDVAPKQIDNVPKAIVMTANCHLDLPLGNTITFQVHQRVTDAQIIGYIRKHNLPHRVE